MEYFFAFIALTAMEIVLGIDNIVFIAIVTDRLPESVQPLARRVGLILAMVMRILLLFTLSLLLRLESALFHISSLGLSGGWLSEDIDAVSAKDLILLAGGLFLIQKSVVEIHKRAEGREGDEHRAVERATLGNVLFQIALMDLIFSIDSIITAVGMVRAEGEGFWTGIGIMVTAVVVSVIVMLIFAEAISNFVKRHATLKILALSFLILIGVMLVAEGIGTHFDKGYIYFAMAFALAVEFINIRVRRRSAASKPA